ncbi:unnamed protein product [Nesidiocoris tenuis]|uniref:Uncharacterized protein n=1 Tax=Nesidiocoris tenuis TaxID=355587 RepID=A0A6H5HI41_9HEMI|nr:unnamed protein product [Nesidiocoris tenuis]
MNFIFFCLKLPRFDQVERAALYRHLSGQRANLHAGKVQIGLWSPSLKKLLHRFRSDKEEKCLIFSTLYYLPSIWKGCHFHTSLSPPILPIDFPTDVRLSREEMNNFRSVGSSRGKPKGISRAQKGPIRWAWPLKRRASSSNDSERRIACTACVTLENFAHDSKNYHHGIPIVRNNMLQQRTEKLRETIKKKIMDDFSDRILVHSGGKTPPHGYDSEDSNSSSAGSISVAENVGSIPHSTALPTTGNGGGIMDGGT